MKANHNPPITIRRRPAGAVLNKLLDIATIDRLLANQRQFGARAYPVEDYLAVIHRGIWGDLASGRVIDAYRRNLQKSYIGSLQNILLSTKADQTETDGFSLVRADILAIQREVAAALPKVTDRMTKYHLQDIQVRIRNTLEANPTIQ
ncbi:MAG TPA: hypothetical protein VN616_02555 [Puia sp.]|nr:hypothetical protein [Puia sp.]